MWDAIEFLGAVRVSSGWAYRAAETGRWYALSEADIEDLAMRLAPPHRARERQEAYSLWCAAGYGREMSDDEAEAIGLA